MSTSPQEMIPMETETPLDPTILLTAAEVSELFEIPLPTVYYLKTKEQLPVIRIGKRFRFQLVQLAETMNLPRNLALALQDRIRQSRRG